MDQIWPCRKIGQGQPRVIIWANLVVLEHPRFKVSGLLISEKKNCFLSLYYIWAWRPTWSCDQDNLSKHWFPRLIEAPDEVWLWLVALGTLTSTYSIIAMIVPKYSIFIFCKSKALQSLCFLWYIIMPFLNKNSDLILSWHLLSADKTVTSWRHIWSPKVCGLCEKPHDCELCVRRVWDYSRHLYCCYHGSC